MMKKRISILLAAVSSLLLVGSVVGSARAALLYYSEDYVAQMDVKSIGVSLVENGDSISWRDYLHKDDAWNQDSGVLLSNLLAKGETLVLNKKYKEELSVRNSGTIDEYVRVTVNRYWVEQEPDTGEASGNKRMDLDPALIQVHFPEENGWLVDPKSSTNERTVLYYHKILKSGETSPLFADTISINDKVAQIVSKEQTTDENGYTIIKSIYEYDGVQFMLQADVDAVQTHNAREAIGSAWGVEASIAEDGTLSLE